MYAPDDYTERLNAFLSVPGSRFVDPEKAEAVLLYGFDKAEAMWNNGRQPSPEMIKILRLSSCNRAVCSRPGIR